MPKNEVMQILEARWSAIFSRLAAGEDVSPTDRLRTEGMMLLASELELCSVDSLKRAMETMYMEHFEHSLIEQWGEDWQELFPFPQVPGYGLRAPVYPSTSQKES